MTERKHYCRACGENKGHSFGSCKNASGLKAIILEQDSELAQQAGRISRLVAVEAKCATQTETITTLSRVVHALLDLCEQYRSKRQ